MGSDGSGHTWYPAPSKPLTARLGVVDAAAAVVWAWLALRGVATLHERPQVLVAHPRQRREVLVLRRQPSSNGLSGERDGQGRGERREPLRVKGGEDQNGMSMSS